jgi:hypothetical protein
LKNQRAGSKHQGKGKKKEKEMTISTKPEFFSIHASYFHRRNTEMK